MGIRKFIKNVPDDLTLLEHSSAALGQSLYSALEKYSEEMNFQETGVFICSYNLALYNILIDEGADLFYVMAKWVNKTLFENHQDVNYVRDRIKEESKIYKDLLCLTGLQKGLNLNDLHKITQDILLDSDKEIINIYSVIAVNIYNHVFNNVLSEIKFNEYLSNSLPLYPPYLEIEKILDKTRLTVAYHTFNFYNTFRREQRQGY